MRSATRFDAVREAVAQRGTPAHVFFRDDDADGDIPQLRSLLGLFDQSQVPLCLAVIPGTLNTRGVELLRSARAGQTLELHQHGWMHVNHEAAGRKCEFGASRSSVQQLNDIALGKERLASMLGFEPAPLFTPPWNRCTAETGAALAELGFRGLSRIRTAPVMDTPAALSDVSVAVDLFTWKQGTRRKSDEQLCAEIIHGLASAAPLGILLHHKVMSQADLEVTRDLIAALRAGPVSFCAMEELCRSGN